MLKRLLKLSSRAFLTGFLLLFLGFNVSAYEYPGDPINYVSDFANIISQAEEDYLNSKLKSFDDETSNQISVVTIKSLGGDTIENYAVKLFEAWKIGQAKKDNGILLLIAVEDRKLRIEVGYGLEGALTDLQSSLIIKNDITPSFKEGKYYEGIDKGVSSIMQATKGEYAGEAVKEPYLFERAGETVKVIGVLLFFGWFIFNFLEGLLGSTKSWWLGGVLGGIGAVLYGVSTGLIRGLIAFVILVPLGLLLDYILSKIYKPGSGRGFGGGRSGGFFSGGGSHFSSGGGLGGFGGGRSGGGGSSGGW